MTWTQKEVLIKDIKSLLEAGYEIEVDSPDGFVPVTNFVSKGMWDEYVLIVDGMSLVRCNENHLFETISGWLSAKKIQLLNEKILVLTKTGYKFGEITKTGNKIPIVDIQVDHDNHRYYTNDVSSHNTGVGKSLAMCHFASANLSDGKNVLYITLEMSEEKISERIDANLLDVNIQDIADMPKDSFIKKINEVKKRTVGKLVVKEYPTSTANANHFRYLLNELKLKKNFVPDIIYIDYINLCSSSRVKMSGGVNSYTYIKSIAEELRGLAVEFDVPVVSATQVNRQGWNNSDVGLENTSESFGLPATADLMFALISTEELEALNQIMVKQLKNRYSDVSRYRKFVVGINKSKMRLYDLEEAAQKSLSADPESQEEIMQKNNGKSKFKNKKFEDITY